MLFLCYSLTSSNAVIVKMFDLLIFYYLLIPSFKILKLNYYAHIYIKWIVRLFNNFFSYTEKYFFEKLTLTFKYLPLIFLSLESLVPQNVQQFTTLLKSSFLLLNAQTLQSSKNILWVFYCIALPSIFPAFLI